MKPWLTIAAFLALSAPALASKGGIVDCLNAVDVPCAEKILEGYNLDSTKDSELLYLGARTHFFAGRYTQASDVMNRAVDLGYNDRWDEQS
ncbi:MAG: hypothetical protein AB8H79_08425, partial [Myxococcota bacterium]